MRVPGTAMVLDRHQSHTDKTAEVFIEYQYFTWVESMSDSKQQIERGRLVGDINYKGRIEQKTHDICYARGLFSETILCIDSGCSSI
jgi:hypothetical protein